MELEILHTIQSIRNNTLDKVMVLISTLGDNGFVWILICIVLLRIYKFRACGIAAVISLIGATIMGNAFLKNIISRNRPCWIDDSIALLINNPKDYSFPSGHTYASFAVSVAIFMYYKKLGSVLIVLATLIGFSRLYLFVHYPSDVLAGMILGIITGILSAKFCNEVVWERIKNKDGRRL